MSDDRYLGSVCGCIPRRFFVLALAVVLVLHGVFEIVFVLFFNVAHEETRQGGNRGLTPGHCYGRECREIVTCAGSRDATYHLHKVCDVGGSILFGAIGVVGCLGGRDAAKLTCLAGFFAFMALMLAVCVGADAMYIMSCGAFPYHVIWEAVLWALPGFPVTATVKYQLQSMSEFPVHFVHELTQLRVMGFYVFIQFVSIAFWLYVSHVTALLAKYTAYGVYGLGANYSIRSWKEAVMNKDKAAEVVGGMKANLYNTLEDTDWKPEEGRVGGPWQSRAGYGAMPRPARDESLLLAGPAAPYQVW